MERKELLKWYKENYRPLPWRKSKDPYSIWISEIMLQQTTVKAVIPYFERFMKAFPSIDHLANAHIEDVYENWSGLGYYSRARNIHNAAKTLSERKKLPNTWQEWIQLPGIGDYTSRAISSFSFGENVGVLDGNVIRFLSRHNNLKIEWWTTSGKKMLQSLSDDWAKKEAAAVNQALIEIGATICTPQNPSCLICPVMKSCKGKRNALSLPLKRKKRAQENWLWTVDVYERKSEFGLVKNDYAPWLKNQLVWPGRTKKLQAIPKKFDYKHAITHHNIYIKVNKSIQKPKNVEMHSRSTIKRKAPQSIIQKTFEHL